ncbi:tetrapyrrole methylase family protein / MazG family protein [Gracilibacillus orientalis]|uniref:Tetrapyrrole methylase family protein / MazG family protein n=1 Tax=Gracilibacillus orientalis TaxID=334253 RepID=A0A1I4RCS8_9BACI|nr:nucleoside triphosphate pyrophosphohydrolase [Gracilibacillus orientalis]SFM50019.1 tetrapyrrole methylase family protein / MazG family protein [Gracilibacillus orientalis]
MKPLIEIIGLGGGDINQLPLGIYRKLTSEQDICYVRTLDHPVIHALQEESVHFSSFDAIYEKYDQFEVVYHEIVRTLIDTAIEKRNIVYAVPGHPMLAEQTVQLLIQHPDVEVEIVGGQSFLDDLFSALKIDPIEGFQFVDGTSFSRRHLQYEQHLVFCQVYDTFIASEVKLTLLEDLPAEYPVYIVDAVGSEEEAIKEIPLVELDQQMQLSNLTSVYIPPIDKEKLNHKFYHLKEVIAALRAPGGCPWDQKQTHETLKKYLIEETYEVIEAIDREDDEAIAEELGDVLLQIMLHSQIGEEAGFFTIDDVIYSITEKMIRRHPHVFGELEVEDESEVIKNWEAIKKEEKGNQQQTLLSDLTKGLPATLLAEDIQKTVAKVGFDWSEPEPIWAKIYEELEELKDARENESFDAQEKEFGDILFAMINLGRYYKINPEIALMRTNQKFTHRFQFVEQKVKESKQPWKSFTLNDLDRFWEEAKRFEN